MSAHAGAKETGGCARSTQCRIRVQPKSRLCVRRWNCYDLLNNRNAWWAPGKVVEIRRRLEPIWRVRSLLGPAADEKLRRAIGGGWKRTAACALLDTALGAAAQWVLPSLLLLQFLF